jgi:hypothetical protein
MQEPNGREKQDENVALRGGRIPRNRGANAGRPKADLAHGDFHPISGLRRSAVGVLWRTLRAPTRVPKSVVVIDIIKSRLIKNFGYNEGRTGPRPHVNASRYHDQPVDQDGGHD